jgi:hypothetical protein
MDIRNTKFQALELTLVAPPSHRVHVSALLFLNGCRQQIDVWGFLQSNKSTQSFVKLGNMVQSSKGGGEALTHARTNTVV